ncbi:heavy metal translocating P-type ATPase [Lacticaseibacillus brantae]|uniref:Cd(2+)-exporting ATPase n=1 Tax=Lacticaseibacillus brantae DSM 23927 TaxID=1423727 RepID=A0A0R2B112_9LACO|nr:heavy metal translocating P-type ATPase [Lacticaseibacillus brantae]KRM72911.1 cadA protein [Lacticaseibacillus brantae DSM 23927]
MKLLPQLQKHRQTLIVVVGSLIVLATIGQYGLRWQAGYQILMLVASLIGFLPIGLQAWSALRVKVISIDLLVSVAVIGAVMIGENNESAIVTFLFLLGAFLEQKTMEKTRSAIGTLTQMAPAQAILITESGHQTIDIDDVDPGDVMLVKTGGQVPVDGHIVKGSGYVNEASITGEAKPMHKGVGEQVFAGAILDNGTLEVAAEKVGEDTTFGKIIELVEEAQDAKSSVERLIDKFATYYTPIVLVIALIVGLMSRDVRLAITILVLGCPGALVIGVPVANVAGVGQGAKQGILLKGGEVMATFKHVDTFVFDKTGTLTYGRPKVASVKTYGQDEATMLAAVANIERESDHPLGQAIIAYAPAVKQTVTDTQVIQGKGVVANVDAVPYLVGNSALMRQFGVALNQSQQYDLKALQDTGHSVVLVATGAQLQLIIGIKDQLRPEVPESLRQLRQMGAQQLIMLTGDNQVTADQIGLAAGLDTVQGDLLPEAKADYVRQLQAQGHVVAFVGDGINDSPSIARADIGIAMGSGTDVAVETSDVVLIQSNFRQLVVAFGLTKKTVANMQENIGLALATVALLFVGLVLGQVNMGSGMFVHEVSILLVTVNALRLLAPKQKLDDRQLQVADRQLD